MASDLEKWRTQQINAAIERGINPIDAANAMRAFLIALPPGADPSTFVVSALTLEQALSSEPVLSDARGAWYATVEPRLARLLDAGVTNG